MNDHPADRPIDATDVALLTELAELYDAVDPIPPDLIGRLSFTLALDEVFAEVAAMTRVSGELTTVRGEAAAVRTETMTFSAECLTVMLTVTPSSPGRVRVDGWVAPAAPLPIRLRMSAGRVETVADDTGRFSFADLPCGYVQLSFGAGTDDECGRVVVTPSFEL